MLEIGTKVAINRLIRECTDVACTCKHKNCLDVVERVEDRDNGSYCIVQLRKAEKKYSSRDLTFSSEAISDKELVDLAKRRLSAG